MEKMLEWNSMQNPLKKILGGESIAPTITTDLSHSLGYGSIVICEALEEEFDLWEMIKGTR